MRVVMLSAMFAVLACGAAWAQSHEDAMVSYMDAQQRAAAASVRPGDETLSCQAIELELSSVMSSPEMVGAQDSLAASSAASADQANAMANRARGQMATNMAMGLASQFVPGLGMAQSMMQRGQAERQMAQSQEHMAAMMQSMEAMAPGLARAQRLSELAQAQSCAFMQAPPMDMAAMPNE
ncbi:MAG TPA: hypothetical protein VM915_04505 [Verrucomicrobiae bacterium]|jgi:hypothetical protein|nr:hypothetical protein [Verrucomicrobiae bacterium]